MPILFNPLLRHCIPHPFSRTLRTIPLFPLSASLTTFTHPPIPHFPFHLQGLIPLSRPLKRLAHTFRSTPTPLDSVVFLGVFISQFFIKPINICIDKYVHKCSYICCVLFNLVLSRLVCLTNQDSYHHQTNGGLISARFAISSVDIVLI